MPDQWDTRFDSHPLWGAIATVKSHLDTAGLPTDPQMSAAYGRISRMVTTVEAYRDAENSKDLFTNTMLQSAYNAVTQYVVSPLAQYVQDPAAQAASLPNAADNVDTVYDELAKWPALSTRGRAVAAGQAAAQYEEASTKALGAFNDQTGELRTQLANLRSEFDEQVDQVRQSRVAEMETLSQAANQQLETLSVQIGGLEARVEQHREKVEALTTSTEANLQDQIDTFEANAQQEISETIAVELKAIRDKTDSTVAATRKSRDDVDTLHSEVAELTKQTRNTVEAFARRAVADDYQKNARNKSFAGWFWDIIGFAVGTVPLILVLWHFLAIPDSPNSVANLTLTRVGISAAAVGVAALCFHRGRQNHKESRLAKRTDLRIRTVHEFLANLDPDVQQAVLEGMADQIYLQGRLDDPGDTSSGSERAERNLLQKYLDKVIERRDKATYEENSIA